MNNAELARVTQFKKHSQQQKKTQSSDPDTTHANLAHTLSLYKDQLAQAIAKRDAQKISYLKDKLFHILAEQTAAKLHAYKERYHMLPDAVQKGAINMYTHECATIELYIQQHMNRPL